MTTIDRTWYRKPTSVPDRSSAGGIVVRLAADRLLIALVREANIPHFVLPKGGVDVGEDVEHAARREIAEEAGLTNLTLIRELAVQERLSYDKQAWLIIHYFLFTTTQALGIPTDTAHHTAMWWFPIDELPALLWPEQQALLQTKRDLIEQLVRHNVA